MFLPPKSWYTTWNQPKGWTSNASKNYSPSRDFKEANNAWSTRYTAHV